MLQPGEAAPRELPFTKEDESVGTLADYEGSWVVVYFYPRDNTPGCTLEAEGFRDMQDEFAARNAVVLGVSTDSCASHRKFIEGKRLPFSLVADTEHALMDAFGTWQQKIMAGREYMGTVRATFLIDPSVHIAHVWDNVRPDGHPREVLAVLDTLRG